VLTSMDERFVLTQYHLMQIKAQLRNISCYYFRLID
jgi:hypothetical protein